METATLHLPLTCAGWLDSSGVESSKVMGKQSLFTSSALTGIDCAQAVRLHTSSSGSCSTAVGCYKVTRSTSPLPPCHHHPLLRMLPKSSIFNFISPLKAGGCWKASSSTQQSSLSLSSTKNQREHFKCSLVKLNAPTLLPKARLI